MILIGHFLMVLLPYDTCTSRCQHQHNMCETEANWTYQDDVQAAWDLYEDRVRNCLFGAGNICMNCLTQIGNPIGFASCLFGCLGANHVCSDLEERDRRRLNLDLTKADERWGMRLEACDISREFCIDLCDEINNPPNWPLPL